MKEGNALPQHVKLMVESLQGSSALRSRAKTIINVRYLRPLNPARIKLEMLSIHNEYDNAKKKGSDVIAIKLLIFF